MTQTVVNYSSSPSGAELLDDMLAKEQENILSSNCGTQRPSYAIRGTLWLDIATTPWVLKIYDGADDITLGTLDTTSNIFVPSIPLSNTGDLITQGTNGKPSTVSASSIVDSVLTSNGANSLPSYKKPPIGVYVYSADRTFNINDVAISATSNNITFYRSKNNSNTGNALTNTTWWEAFAVYDNVKLSGNQTIAGTKTFSSSPVLPTPAVSDNSTKGATTAYINNKFKVVSALPSSPDTNTFYFITA